MSWQRIPHPWTKDRTKKDGWIHIFIIFILEITKQDKKCNIESIKLQQKIQILQLITKRLSLIQSTML